MSRIEPERMPQLRFRRFRLVLREQRHAEVVARHEVIGRQFHRSGEVRLGLDFVPKRDQVQPGEFPGIARFGREAQAALQHTVGLLESSFAAQNHRLQEQGPAGFSIAPHLRRQYFSCLAQTLRID